MSWDNVLERRMFWALIWERRDWTCAESSVRGTEPGDRDALGCDDATVNGDRESLRKSAGSKFGSAKLGGAAGFDGLTPARVEELYVCAISVKLWERWQLSRGQFTIEESWPPRGASISPRPTAFYFPY